MTRLSYRKDGDRWICNGCDEQLETRVVSPELFVESHAPTHCLINLLRRIERLEKRQKRMR